MLKCQLTPREREALYWVSYGKTNEEIAVIMGTGKYAVHGLLQKARIRNDVINTPQLLALAFRSGEIE